MIRFFIPGDPVPKGRPRMTRTGHTYTPEKTRTYESKIGLFGSQAMSGKSLLEGPIRVDMMVVLPIPDSWNKKKKEEALACRLFPTGRKDLDNFIKCLDGLNGIVWHDDGQICSIMAKKAYGERPGMYLEIAEIWGIE